MAAELVPGAPPGLGHLVWRQVTVRGRRVLYGEAGSGMPLLFVHGWGLGQHAYKRALEGLAGLGCRVIAPGLPGFGGTPDLPARQLSFEGYASWLQDFLDVIGLEEPVCLVGHSFGGGVAIQLAHDAPGRVSSLVLVDSVGGPGWARGARWPSLAERAAREWWWGLPAELIARGIGRALPRVLEDALPNVLRNPLGLWRSGALARKADLTAELAELRRRRLPVVVLWGSRDQIIPRSSFEALCRALGSEGQIVAGSHGWLLADPDAFCRAMTNVIGVAQADGNVSAVSARRRELPAPVARRPADQEGERPPPGAQGAARGPGGPPDAG